MIRPLRLGIVPYLNVLPLIEGLEGAFPRSGWTFATPRSLARQLVLGDLDVAIVSTFEALRRPGLAFVPGCAIGCDGPVRSVQLFGRGVAEGMGRILLDRSSLTSIHLAQVLLADLAGVHPVYELSGEPLTPASCRAAVDCDGVVAIGDTALEMDGRWPFAMDLGAAWKDLTGMPFVFAAWVVREGLVLSPEEISAFAEARERGVRAIPAIATREGMRGKFDAKLVEDYLGHSIRYGLGERELGAVEEFRRRLVEHGFVEEASGVV